MDNELSTFNQHAVDKVDGRTKAKRGRDKVAGYHNQANLKAMARGQILEALTANKGGKLGKRGLIFRIIESIEADFDSQEASVRREARADALKMAMSMTKPDSNDHSLAELLSKQGANIQINFNSYFEERDRLNKA